MRGFSLRMLTNTRPSDWFYKKKTQMDLLLTSMQVFQALEISVFKLIFSLANTKYLLLDIGNPDNTTMIWHFSGKKKLSLRDSTRVNFLTKLLKPWVDWTWIRGKDQRLDTATNLSNITRRAIWYWWLLITHQTKSTCSTRTFQRLAGIAYCC